MEGGLMGLFNPFKKKPLARDPDTENISDCYHDYYLESANRLRETRGVVEMSAFIGSEILDYIEYDLENFNILLKGCNILPSREKILYFIIERATLFIIEADLHLKKHTAISASDEIIFNLINEFTASVKKLAPEGKLPSTSDDFLALWLLEITSKRYKGHEVSSLYEICCRRCVNVYGLGDFSDIAIKQLRPLVIAGTNYFGMLILPLFSEGVNIAQEHQQEGSPSNTQP
jgi:hypothetical protein